MNQIDETEAGAGREIERTWTRLRAQDADPHTPEIDGNDIEDEANDLEQIIDNDDLVMPEMLDDPEMDDSDLSPYDSGVPTDEPEYGDHRDVRIRQDNEMTDSGVGSLTDTTD